MSNLDGFYLSQLRLRERDELDRWMANRLANPVTPKGPGASAGPETLTLGEEFTRGIARGGANVVGSMGTLLKAGGLVTGSNLMTQAGESMATYWSQVADANAPSAAARESLWDNPWAVLNPHWLTASVAESLPSLAAAMVPAGGAGAALSIGGKLIGWSPAVALKLARIGAAVTGGAVGGGLEGASTFEEVKRRGGSDDDALKALAFMGLASAGLNALSLGQAFKTPARAGLGALAKRVGIAGTSEGLTEWLEEPTEAVILGEDWQGVMEAAKRGLNVVPAAVLTGGAANVAVGAAKGAKDAGKTLAGQEGRVGTPQGDPEELYKPVGELVDGRKVRGEVPNRNSIDATLTEYEELSGIREVPFSAFTQMGPLKYHSVAEEKRTKRLAEEIKESGEIAPLIVVVDNEGPYILEGGHRFDALREVGAASFPAVVVIDKEATKPGMFDERGSMIIGGEDDGKPGGGGLVPPAPPTGPGGPTDPGAEGDDGLPRLHVNLKYVDGDRAFKHLTASVNLRNTERLEGDRKTRGVADMRAEGHRKLPTLKDAMEWDPEAAPAKELPGTLRALADWRDAATQHLEDTRELAKTDPGAKWDVWRAFTVAGELAARVEVGESILGRGMRMQQETSLQGNAPFDPKDLMALADQMRDASDINVDAFMARMDTLSARQKKVMAKQSVTLLKAGQNALYEAWINGLLSGPQTHVVNPLSNTLTTLWAIPERALASQFHTGVDPGVVKGEASAMLRGITEGFLDGLRIARLAWRDFEGGTDTTGMLNRTKLDLPKHAINAGAFGQDPSGSLGQALDYLGTGVRMPSRLMASTDAFFKAVNYRMELKALSLRQAIGEGLDGDALVRRVQQIEANPPAEVKERAEQFMLLQTFQNDLGEAGQSIMKGLDLIPGARLVLPFIKTPTNIAKWAIYRTPGLNLLSRQFRADLAEQGPTRDLALARASMGAMVAGSVAMLAGAGLITGGGPSDPELKRQLRETGWQAYSLKVGDSYYSYNRLDPIGAVIGLVADTSEIIGQIPEAKAETLAGAVVLSLSKTMVSKTYLQGLSDAIEAISNPERGAAKYAQRFAQTLIPTGVRTIERAITDPTLREARSVLESIQSVVPGWSSSLPPRRNLFGEVVSLSGGLGPDLISPIYTSTLKDDPVSQEIARHRVDISLPSRTLEGRRHSSMQDRGVEGVELSPKEYDRYARLAGEGLRADLKDVIASGGYQSASDGPDGGKALLIRHVVQIHRQIARAKLFDEEPAVTQRHQDYLERRASALAGTLRR